jgi:RHS repeat-associated protein
LYQYNGKELVEDNGLGWNHYGARAYDAAVGRWWVIDPMAEKYKKWSGYHYVKCDPINLLDPDGMQATNEYTIYTKNGVPQSTVLTGTKGGNTTDYIKVIDTEKSATGPKADAIATFEVDVVTTFTSGAGNESRRDQEANPTPGSREAHGKDFIEIDAALMLFSGGSSVATETTILAARATKATGNIWGSYTNTHQSGKKYHGAGGQKRAEKSANDKAKEHNDPVVSTDWSPSPTKRDQYKDESRRLEGDGGHRSNSNYNKRASPGTNYRKKDGDD